MTLAPLSIEVPQSAWRRCYRNFKSAALVLIHARRLLGAFEQLDRVPRHDSGDRMLIDKLRMPVPPQQHAEVIEPGHHALQLHSIHQKNGERNFALSDMIEECVL